MNLLKKLWSFVKKLFFILWNYLFMRKKMKHICYIYIKRFKVLENIGVLLDSNFAVSLDNESRTIRIARNENLSKNFWGTGIYSIAGIFGNNGSGKSTTLSCLMDLLLDGSAAKSFDGVLIYESDNNLYVYQNLPGEEFSFDCAGIMSKKPNIT